MTPADPAPEQPDKPVVRDRRRIDPTTGQVREPDPATEATEQAQTSADAAAEDDGRGTDAAADPAAADATAEAAPGALAAAKAEAAELSDQLARRTADLYNVQQEYNAYVRRSKTAASEQHQAGVVEVAEALLGVLDEIALARAHGDLTGPFAAIAEKLESTLEQRFGIVQFGAVGEEFDPAVHEALMHSADAEATSTTVAQVLQPGYRVGERVLRAARVAVTGPQ